MADCDSVGLDDGTSTCGNLLRRLFPGLDAERTSPYLAFPFPEGVSGAPYRMPPVLPPDVFAVAAHLLDLSGAYHHVIPVPPHRPQRAKRLVLIEEADIARARSVAAAWREFRPELPYADGLASTGLPLSCLFAWWHDVFFVHGRSPVFRTIDSRSPPPAWWKPTVMLLIAADEAARGVGYQVHVRSGADGRPVDQPWISMMVERQIVATFEAQGAKIDAEPGSAHLSNGVSTISVADLDMVAVLPKARTTAVGCTLRSLSHHLALLPPRGVARASWTPYLFRKSPPDEQHLNLLLVPFPFTVPARAFKGSASADGSGIGWGFFEVEQTWLEDVTVDMLIDFVKALVTEAERECDAIHGVVFPELALDHETYQGLSERLPKIMPAIELLVAGQSGDPQHRTGNFVSVTVYQHDQKDDAKTRGIMTRREKHHRWKLDRGQILAYGLEGVLSPSLGWWEDIDLLSRRVDFSVFRSNSVLSAMICEDLARVDPCQELLRSIGPSLVFALLMDAPQLRTRWPARYATVLAEDPGTAVLTLTSRALMTRQYRLGIRVSKGPDDRIIGLWRDDGGVSEEIECPEDAHAVRLTLSGQKSIDITLDGRDDRSAVSWRYAARRPVRIADVKTRFPEIIGSDERASP